MFFRLYNDCFLYQEEEEKEIEEEEGGETEPPSNQTETPPSRCQTAGREIICRGIGMTHLPIIHNLEATNLDMAGVCVCVCIQDNPQ